MQGYIQESFLLEEGKEHLVARRHYNGDNLLMEYEDYWNDDRIKTCFAYDELKRLIQSTEYQDGTEISKTCYTYDKEGEIVEEIIEVNGYLFEKHVLEKTPNGYNRKTFQDDLVLEEIIRENKDENTFEERTYHSGDLTEHHFVSVLPASRREMREIHLILENKRIFVEEHFDADENRIYLKETDEKQRILTEERSEFKNRLLIRKIMLHHVDQKEIGVETSEFDLHGNLTKWLKQDRNGNPLESDQMEFDEFNRLVSQIGVRRGDKTHLIMRYKEM